MQIPDIIEFLIKGLQLNYEKSKNSQNNMQEDVKITKLQVEVKH